MDQSRFLSQVLWMYQDSSQFTDVTLVCEDGRLAAHTVVMTGLFSRLGLTFACMWDVPDLILLPDLSLEDLQVALRDLYMDNRGDTLMYLLGQTSVTSVDKHSPSESYPKVLDAEDSLINDIFSSQDNLWKEEENLPEEIISKSFEIQTNRPKKFRGPKYTISERKIKDKCSYCKKIVYRHFLTDHLTLKHREIVLLQHPEIVMSKPCQECDLMFFSLKDLGKHSWRIHGHSLKESKCKTCQVSFESRKLYKTHHSKVHKQSKTIDCQYCKYKSETTDRLNNHIYNTHSNKTYLHPEIKALHVCKHCNKQFYWKNAKTTHIKLAHTANSVCPKCSKVCVNIVSLELHMLNHENNQFVCELCSKSFKIKRYLKIHVDSFHNGKKFSPTCIYRCKLCSKGNFSSEEVLQKHILDNHSGVEYRCSECQKVFANTDARRRHKQTMHGEKTEKCDECDGMFRTNVLLRCHIRIVHNKVKDKICPLCGQEYYNKAVLQTHIDRHENNRQWKCEYCDKRFLTHRAQKSHMDRHNLAYQCSQCEKKKGSTDELNEHTRRVHGGVQLKCRYGCGYHSWGTGNRGRHETNCQLNPIPGAPHSVSIGSASQFVLETYHNRIKEQESDQKI